MRDRIWMKWAGLLLAVVFAGGAARLAAQDEPGSQAFILGGGEGSWLGVEIEDVTATSAQQMKLPGIYGAVVESVEPGGPAAKAGIEKGDVILEFDGERVLSVATLRRLVSETPGGRTVAVEISRNGETKNLQITPEKRPGNSFFFDGPSIRVNPKYEFDQKFKAMPLPNPEAPGMQQFNFRFFATPPVLGIEGDDLTGQLARFFGVTQGKGVLVREVTEGSPAAKAGLKAGDVIVKVDSKVIGSVEELRDALGQPSDQARKVLLTIVRNREEKLMTVQLEPIQNQDIRKIQAWRDLGLSPHESEELARQARQIAAEYQGKAGDYQKAFEQMEKQLQIELEPLKQNLQKEVDQIRMKVQDQIRHEMNIHREMNSSA